jgi:hypothetical protein
MKDFKIQCFNPVSHLNDCKCKGITLIPPKNLPPNCLISVIINSFDNIEQFFKERDCTIVVDGGRGCIYTKEGYVPMYYIASEGLKPIIINCLDKKYKYTMDILIQIPPDIGGGGNCGYKIQYFQQIIINDKACNKTYYLDPKEKYCVKCVEDGQIIDIKSLFDAWTKAYNEFIIASANLSLELKLLNISQEQVNC